jgi:hypothetical protein
LDVELAARLRLAAVRDFVEAGIVRVHCFDARARAPPQPLKHR